MVGVGFLKWFYAGHYIRREAGILGKAKTETSIKCAQP